MHSLGKGTSFSYSDHQNNPQALAEDKMVSDGQGSHGSASVAAVPGDKLSGHSCSMAEPLSEGRTLPERQVSSSSDDEFYDAHSEIYLSASEETEGSNAPVASSTDETAVLVGSGEDTDDSGWTTVTRQRKKTAGKKPSNRSSYNRGAHGRDTYDRNLGQGFRPQSKAASPEALVNLTKEQFDSILPINDTPRIQRWLASCRQKPHEILSRVLKKPADKWARNEYEFVKAVFVNLIKKDEYIIPIFQVLLSYYHQLVEAGGDKYNKRLSLFCSLNNVYPKRMNIFRTEEYQQGERLRVAKDFAAIYRQEGGLLFGAGDRAMTPSNRAVFILVIHNMRDAVNDPGSERNRKEERLVFDGLMEELERSIGQPQPEGPVKRTVFQSNLAWIVRSCSNELTRAFMQSPGLNDKRIFDQIDKLHELVDHLQHNLEDEQLRGIEANLCGLRIHSLPAYSKIYGYDEAIKRMEALNERLTHCIHPSPRVLSRWRNVLNFRLANALLHQVEDRIKDRKAQEFSEPLARAWKAIDNYEQSVQADDPASDTEERFKHGIYLHSMYHRLRAQDKGYSDKESQKWMSESMKQLSQLPPSERKALEIAKWYIASASDEDYHLAFKTLTETEFRTPLIKIKQLRLLVDDLWQYDMAIEDLKQLCESQKSFPPHQQVFEHQLFNQLAQAYYKKSLWDNEGNYDSAKISYQYICEAMKKCPDKRKYLGLLIRICRVMKDHCAPFKTSARMLPGWLHDNTVNGWGPLMSQLHHQHKEQEPLSVETAGFGIQYRQKRSNPVSGKSKPASSGSRGSLKPKPGPQSKK